MGLRFCPLQKLEVKLGRRCFKRIHSLWWGLGMDGWTCPFEYGVFLGGQHIFWGRSSPDIRMWFSWATRFLWPSISGWLSSMGFDMFDNSCQSSYLLANTSKQSKDMPQASVSTYQDCFKWWPSFPEPLHCTPVFTLPFLSIFLPSKKYADVLQTHPYTFLGPKGACQLCPLEDLRRGCSHLLASACYGGNGGTFHPAVVEFFCVLTCFSSRLKCPICCESLWPFIQAGFRDSLGPTSCHFWVDDFPNFPWTVGYESVRSLEGSDSIASEWWRFER